MPASAAGVGKYEGVTAQLRHSCDAASLQLSKLARLHHHPHFLKWGGVASAREGQTPREGEALNPKP